MANGTLFWMVVSCICIICSILILQTILLSYLLGLLDCRLLLLLGDFRFERGVFAVHMIQVLYVSFDHKFALHDFAVDDCD